MPKKTYTREFKIEAVKLSYNSDKTRKEIAEELGISVSSLSRWRKEYGEDPDQAFPGKGKMKERDAEIARLKKELRQAEMEKEILKKALATPSASRRHRDEVSIHRGSPRRVSGHDYVSVARGFTQRVLRMA